MPAPSEQNGGEHLQRPPTASTHAHRSTSYTSRSRSDDSWVEIASQPSSSSLSSVGDEIVTTGLRVQHESHTRRRRRLRPGAPTHLNIASRPPSAGGTSSQEEYEESESESDRVLTSSNEGLPALATDGQSRSSSASNAAMDSEDENRTAINQPTNQHHFTPQPNAFSHPPSQHTARTPADHVPGSYFPGPATRTTARPTTRHSSSLGHASRPQHSPYSIVSPAHNAAADHDAALRASLSTLLSCAAAARGLSKPAACQIPAPSQRTSTRVETSTFRLVPESALPTRQSPTQPIPEPTFNPTIRRPSASTATSADSQPSKDLSKRKAITGRSLSKERGRAVKKVRRAASADELFVSPTLLTWVVSAGVVFALSALSFSAGYSMGREAGKLEASGLGSGGEAGGCAREAGRSGLGFRRLRFAGKV